MTSIRVLMALAAQYNLELHQMDVKIAFLNGVLDEEVCMALPEGLNISSEKYMASDSLHLLTNIKEKLKTEFDSVYLEEIHHCLGHSNLNSTKSTDIIPGDPGGSGCVWSGMVESKKGSGGAKRERPGGLDLPV
ncbi:hypothetical protein AXG93_2798s1040 [Marchantia polymorpha subsp. ruderalis]|uniref:Reverse transcriptase Ty1/copia-type domain-containing protein n=1 Tax=Marchantia polymorpha subsp. ruderalis TaxID=1480154 RepID=A0A176VVD2_MARPO|nr:hypothetical protein AXG93_2798s1040 [Marchantia polymorpha subsp. ruderalis]